MNHARRAAEAGAARIILQRDLKSGEILTERRNDRRQAKKAFKAQGLSGRQIRKLIKEARRAQRAAAKDGTHGEG